jgi:hypothetical protein
MSLSRLKVAPGASRLLASIFLNFLVTLITVWCFVALYVR